MAGSLVVSALVKKRAELAGELEIAEARFQHAMASLLHIDATIRLFDPNLDPLKIAPKRKRRADGSGRAGVIRSILGILRDAGTPLTKRDITVRRMELKGAASSDKALRAAFEKRVADALRHHGGKSVVVASKAANRQTAWQVASLD